MASKFRGRHQFPRKYVESHTCYNDTRDTRSLMTMFHSTLFAAPTVRTLAVEFVYLKV